VTHIGERLKRWATFDSHNLFQYRDISRRKMTCFKCGLQVVPDQKFCRSCGATLQMITQPLAELAMISDRETTPAIIFKDERQPVNNFAGGGFIIMFIGVAIGVIGKMLMHEEIVTVVGVLLTLVGMFLTVYPYLSPARRRKNEFSSSSQPEVQTQSERTNYLTQGSNIEYIPSVTERTTGLLKKSGRLVHKEKSATDIHG
jgi:hypothetical protein